MHEQNNSFVKIDNIEFFDVNDFELIDISVSGNDNTFWVSTDGIQWVLTHNSEYPDIDSDFGDRDLLIKLLKQKFGDDNIVPISNYNTFQLKSLVKDVSRFYGISFEEVQSATRTVEQEVRKATLKVGDDKNLFELKLDDALKFSQSFKEFMDTHPEVLAPIKTLLKENRSLGKHAGGVIIADNVPQRMPVIKSRGELQTPWQEGMHVKELNVLGWQKFDLLGLETMRIIKHAIELIIRRHAGAKLKLEFENCTVECYENDEILLRNGSWKRASSLMRSDDVKEPVSIRAGYMIDYTR